MRYQEEDPSGDHLTGTTAAGIVRGVQGRVISGMDPLRTQFHQEFLHRPGGDFPGTGHGPGCVGLG